MNVISIDGSLLSEGDRNVPTEICPGTTLSFRNKTKAGVELNLTLHSDR